MKTTTTGYLAYFDILGFEQIVKDLPSEELDKLYSFIIRDTQWAYADDQMKVGREIKPVFRNPVVTGVNISDSIVFFTKDDSEESLTAILKAISRFVMRLDSHLAYRGCLVVGSFNYLLGNVKNDTEDIAYNVSAIYGKALIDAYKKAESQEWIGCFIDESVVKYVSAKGFSQNHFSTYVEFDVPFKDGKKKLLALKMTLSDSIAETHEEQVKALFERNGLKYSEKLKMKYENTLAFRKHCYSLSN